MTDLQSVIEKAFDNRANISPNSAEPALKEAVADVIDRLDAGIPDGSRRQSGVTIGIIWRVELEILFLKR